MFQMVSRHSETSIKMIFQDKLTIIYFAAFSIITVYLVQIKANMNKTVNMNLYVSI